MEENFIDKKKTQEGFGYEIPPNPKDPCYLTCPFCSQPKKSSLRALRRTLKKRSRYICSTCYSRSDEGKAQRSKQSKAAWANPEYKENAMRTQKLIANTEEGRAQRSKQSKQAWTNPEYKENQITRVTELFQSQEHRKLVSERNKKDFLEDPEKYLKEKVSAMHTREAQEAHRIALKNPEYRETHSILAKKRFENPEYKAKIAKGIEGFARSGRQSSPEKAIEEILIGLNAEFIKEKALGPYNFDFYIPKINLYIEVQGEYWHTLPNNEQRDKKKYSYLRTADPEARIVYIWDYDLLSGHAEGKLKEVFGICEFPVNEFEFEDLELCEDSNESTGKFLNTWHYAQKGKPGKFVYVAKFKGDIIAVAKFGPVSRKEIATTLGETTKTAFELDRFCIHPMRQKKNFGSYFLSRATKAFFEKFKEIRVIISFSDSTFGHDGSIYKACNWKEHSKVKPNYVYIDNNGWVMHKKTLYNHALGVHSNEKEYAEKNGWKKVFGKEKTKFIMKREGK